ncbi:MAG: DUF2189 domain-containing protein [Gammaproteobacteria bacterium]|nr:DUF2189 domain-containing protein [Gammaproteobacteria bacterium]
MENNTPESMPKPAELPFVAPCRQLSMSAPLRWIKLGWQDIKTAPKPSLTYGSLMLVFSYLVGFIAWEFGSFYMLMSLISGFIFLGPILAIGLYSISCQIQIGLKPILGYCIREGKRHLSNEAFFAILLLIVLLVWARATSIVHVFFPMDSDPNWEDLILFLSIIGVVGTLFAAFIFCFSAFSLPMIMDRKVDMITAGISSFHAVMNNKLVMLFWAFLIVLSIALSFLTGLLGLVVLLPLIGHATWHGYQETIDASAWPKHD